MDCNKQARIIPIKQGSGTATIPPSSDHRNGDWIYSDIYIGEFYMDIDTGALYTRTINGINLVGGGADVSQSIISQVGTNPIIPDEYIFDGIPITTSTRTNVGRYTITTVDAYDRGTVHITNGQGGGFITGVFKAPSAIFIKSYDASGVFSDDIIDEASLTIKLYKDIIS